MGIGSEILADWEASLAALQWQVDLGLTEVIGNTPQNAFDLPEAPPGRKPPPQALVSGVSSQVAGLAHDPGDAVAVARAAARGSETLLALKQAVASFDHCALKKGARSVVFADGHPRARVFVLGEAPGRDEDLEARPFVGEDGQLLDKMFAAIGLGRMENDRDRALYLSAVLPWRLPAGNREPEAAEIAMMLPFVERHIELVNPDVIVTMGNLPLTAMTGKNGILRFRGQWGQVLGRPHLPMVHPSYLRRTPLAKRDAWADLLALKTFLANGQTAGP